MDDQQKPQRLGSGIVGYTGFLVAATGLLVLLGIVAIAILSLPDDENKAQNIVAIATSGFGVIGAVVGAYFGVRAAGNAMERVSDQRAAETPPPHSGDRPPARRPTAAS